MQDVHQSARHLLLVADTDDGLQHGAQRAVAASDELGKLLVALHGQDSDGLVARLDAERRPAPLGLGGCRRAHRVPALYELPARDAAHRDVDQAHVVALVLLLLLVGRAVHVHCEAARGGQPGELEVLAPEEAIVAALASGARMQHVVQAQLAEVRLLGWQVLGLDDPQPQQVLCPSAVVLRSTESCDQLVADDVPPSSGGAEEASPCWAGWSSSGSRSTCLALKPRSS